MTKKAKALFLFSCLTVAVVTATLQHDANSDRSDAEREGRFTPTVYYSAY